tara:strand:- start:95883 stop:97373 length:1491 start_codon:yes stop_codon:yes gene_type:complete
MKTIRNIYLTLFLGIFSISLHAQVQIGSTITASEEGFAFGQNVQISEDSKRIVVSGYGSSEQGVAIFENRNGDWVQQPFEVPSDFPDSPVIYSVAMSSDGTKIALGSVINRFEENNGNVKVFQYVNNTWSQRGTTIESEDNNELFGRSVAISDDGNRVLVGARLNSEKAVLGGRAVVYHYANNTWSQLGEAVYGTEDGFKVGSSTAISSDGKSIFIGSNSSHTKNNPASPFEGYIETLIWENNSWVNQYIEKGGKYDHLGFSVDISKNGEIFATTANQLKFNRGYVKVYRNANGIFNEYKLLDSEVNSPLGSSLSISETGNKIAVLAFDPQSLIQNLWSVIIFEFNTQEYVPIGSIQGDGSFPQYDITMDISPDGNTIVIGSLEYDYSLAGSERGSVKVYDISGLESPEIPEPEILPEFIVDPILIYPSPATNELHCANCSFIAEWYIADITGKVVTPHKYNTSNAQDISMLQSGIYYVYFVSRAGDVEVKKFVKK